MKIQMQLDLYNAHKNDKSLRKANDAANVVATNAHKIVKLDTNSALGELSKSYKTHKKHANTKGMAKTARAICELINELQSGKSPTMPSPVVSIVPRLVPRDVPQTRVEEVMADLTKMMPAIKAGPLSVFSEAKPGDAVFTDADELSRHVWDIAEAPPAPPTFFGTDISGMELRFVAGKSEAQRGQHGATIPPFTPYLFLCNAFTLEQVSPETLIELKRVSHAYRNFLKIEAGK